MEQRQLVHLRRKVGHLEHLKLAILGETQRRQRAGLLDVHRHHDPAHDYGHNDVKVAGQVLFYRLWEVIVHERCLIRALMRVYRVRIDVKDVDRANRFLVYSLVVLNAGRLEESHELVFKFLFEELTGVEFSVTHSYQKLRGAHL